LIAAQRRGFARFRKREQAPALHTLARFRESRVLLAVLLGLWFALLSVRLPARAHGIRPAYFEIKETAPGRFDVLRRTPMMSSARLQVLLKFPESCRNVIEPTQKLLTDSVVERRIVNAVCSILTPKPNH